LAPQSINYIVAIYLIVEGLIGFGLIRYALCGVTASGAEAFSPSSSAVIAVYSVGDRHFYQGSRLVNCASKVKVAVLCAR